jgi:arginase
MSEHLKRTERAYHILGVPFRSGSLYPGSENDAEAYRGARLLERLRAVGCNVVDDGDGPEPTECPTSWRRVA